MDVYQSFVLYCLLAGRGLETCQEVCQKPKTLINSKSKECSEPNPWTLKKQQPSLFGVLERAGAESY
jgi:hypothetical protein